MMYEFKTISKTLAIIRPNPSDYIRYSQNLRTIIVIADIDGGLYQSATFYFQKMHNLNKFNLHNFQK